VSRARHIRRSGRCSCARRSHCPRLEPIEAQQLFFYDLGFTSMDLLDLLFRLEQHFQIEIPEGTTLPPRAWRSRGG
jgi:acyl carrier protein